MEKKQKKTTKRNVQSGIVSVQSTFNNTIISICDDKGGLLSQGSPANVGFKGAKKATPYASTQVVANVSEKVKKYGLKELEVYVKGVGSGREAAVRALANNGFDLIFATAPPFTSFLIGQELKRKYKKNL